MADPYSILGVSKSADEKAIKSAYRKLAKELHPDKNTDNPKAAERFSEVTRAYDLLSDAKKRGQYDRGEIDENGQARAPFGYGGNDFGGSSTGPTGATFDFGGSGIDLGEVGGHGAELAGERLFVDAILSAGECLGPGPYGYDFGSDLLDSDRARASKYWNIL